MSALDGVRVLECGEGVSAAFCTRTLAALGADVVKLEPPDGDPARRWGPCADAADGPQRSAMFAYLNAGKRSVRLSGSAAEDHALIASLASRAGVVVTNLTPERRAAWGLDVGTLAQRDPGLVLLTLSPMGETGPWAHAPLHEINVCALGGMSVILGEPGHTPLSFPFALPAMQTGLHGAAAVLTALLARQRSGRGQRLDVAEADVMAFYAGGMALFILGGGGRWERRGFERHGAIYPSGFYPCRDGFVFLATQSRSQWTAFLRLMGNPAWAEADPVLRDGVAIGWERADEVDLHFIPWLAEHTRAELTDMAAREPDLVLGPINDARDVLAAPHLEERLFWTDVDLGGRSIRMPGFGYTMSATPWHLGPPPRLGAHGGSGWTEARREPLRAPAPRGDRRPLAGYRMIEFGWNWAGPLVGQMLADMGAEVIKVETRARLDFMRHWPHARRFFHNANRGKLSVSINVKTDAGRDLLRRLAGTADVVFDNFSAGVMARNGLGDAELRAHKPDLITMSMAMAGQTGPLRHMRGFATMATGFAGLEATIGYPERGPTGLPAIGIGDANAAIQGVVALLAALWHRERTGEGQSIDLSQIEAAAALAGEPLAGYQLEGTVAGPQANFHPRMCPHGIYPARGSERWVSLAVASDAEWNTLVRVMGAPPWARDESLACGEERHRRRAEIDARLAEWTATLERDELVVRLRAAGLAAAPMLDIDELHTWPHFVARGLWQDEASFEGERWPIYNTPWHFDDPAEACDRPSPKIGEQNDYVFGTLLAMSQAEIDELVRREVIW